MSESQNAVLTAPHDLRVGLDLLDLHATCWTCKPDGYQELSLFPGFADQLILDFPERVESSHLGNVYILFGGVHQWGCPTRIQKG